MDWWQLANFTATLIAGAVGGAALYDRWLRYKNQITGEIEVDVLPGTIERPGANPWDPPIIEEGVADGIVVQATVHNNTTGPIVVKEWMVEGPPLSSSDVHNRGEIIGPGQTGIASTMFVPDWQEWDQRLSDGLTARSRPTIRISLIALSRVSARRLKLRGPKYSIDDNTVKDNASKAAADLSARSEHKHAVVRG